MNKPHRPRNDSYAVRKATQSVLPENIEGYLPREKLARKFKRRTVRLPKPIEIERA
jgi:hypothetical protein